MIRWTAPTSTALGDSAIGKVRSTQMIIGKAGGFRPGNRQFADDQLAF
jgi:hypothetical protein